VGDWEFRETGGGGWMICWRRGSASAPYGSCGSAASSKKIDTHGIQKIGIHHFPVYTFCSTGDNCFLGARPSWLLDAGGTPALPGKSEAAKNVNDFPSIQTSTMHPEKEALNAVFSCDSGEFGHFSAPNR